MGDGVYVLILVGSTALSALLRVAGSRASADIAAACGVGLVVRACGWQALHPASALVLAGLVRRLAPRERLGAAALALAFGHLAALRLYAQLSGPTNAVMLMLSLRLGSVGFDAQDGARAPTGALELARYACCYHGLFTGPFYGFEAWDAAMRAPRPAPSARALGLAVLRAVGVLLVWRGLATALPFGALQPGGALAGAPFGGRLLGYFYLSSFQYRFRFYACWLVMEVGGLLLGFAEPANVDLLGCELASSPSALVSSWNTSVQGWMKRYVYRKLPTRSRPLRQIGVFVASAFWHGVRPGYYVFFAGLFSLVLVEQAVRAAAKAVALGPAAGAPAAGLRWLAAHAWTLLCFTYFGVAFNLLAVPDILAMWATVRHYGVWLAAAPLPLAAAALALSAARRPEGRSERAAGARRSPRLAKCE